VTQWKSVSLKDTNLSFDLTQVTLNLLKNFLNLQLNQFLVARCRFHPYQFVAFVQKLLPVNTAFSQDVLCDRFKFLLCYMNVLPTIVGNPSQPPIQLKLLNPLNYVSSRHVEFNRNIF